MAHFARHRDKLDANAQWKYVKDDGTQIIVTGMYGDGVSENYYYNADGTYSNPMPASELLTALASEVGESVENITFDTTKARNENPVTEAG